MATASVKLIHNDNRPQAIEDVKNKLESFARNNGYKLVGGIGVERSGDGTMEFNYRIESNGAIDKAAKGQFLSKLKDFTTNHGFTQSTVAYVNNGQTTTHNYQGGAPAGVPAADPAPAAAAAPAPSSSSSAKPKPAAAASAKDTATITITQENTNSQAVDASIKRLKAFAANNGYDVAGQVQSGSADGVATYTYNLKATDKAVGKNALLSKLQKFTRDHKYEESTIAYKSGATQTSHTFESYDVVAAPATVHLQVVQTDSSEQAILATKNRLQSFAHRHKYAMAGEIGVETTGNGTVEFNYKLTSTDKARAKDSFLAKLDTFTKDHGYAKTTVEYTYGSKIAGAGQTSTHTFEGPAGAVGVTENLSPEEPVHRNAQAHANADDAERLRAQEGARQLQEQEAFERGKAPAFGLGAGAGDGSGFNFGPEAGSGDASGFSTSFNATERTASGARSSAGNSSNKGTQSYVMSADTLTQSDPIVYAASNSQAEPDTSPTEYVVQRDDNLYRIANAHGTTVDTLVELNGIQNRDLISTGQKLRLPGGTQGSGSGSAPDGAGEYTVVRDDTLTRIAKAHGTSVQEIAELNGIKDSNLILTGQKLKLPRAGGSFTQSVESTQPSQPMSFGGALQGDGTNAGASTIPPSAGYTDPL